MGLRAVVVGAGLGGLTTALALRRTGWDVAVSERADALREVGAGISLWANAFRALDRLGAGDAVRTVCQPMHESETRLHEGRTVVARFRAADFEPRVGVTPFVGMAHRAELVGVLAGLLPAERLRFGRPFAGCDDTGRRVTVHFADGSRDECDVVVGADGLHSAVGRHLFGERPPRYAGYTCWRGITARPTGVPPGQFAEWWGRGQRAGLCTLPGDRLYWYATANAPPGGHAADEQAAVAGRFAGWAAPLPEVIDSTPPAGVLRNDILDRPPARPWSQGRVGLVGDAAHPTTPNFGQGGCLAIEDAVVLARCVSQSADVPAGLRAFEAERFARTAAVTADSWRLGRVGQWQNRLACGLRDRLFGLLLPRLGGRSLPKYAAFDVGPLG